MVKYLHPDMAGEPPPCFTPSAHFGWDEWVAIEIAEYTEPNPNGYCQHCTPAYQRQMKREGRCVHPEVVFTLSEDGFEGVRPVHPAPAEWFILKEDGE